MSSSARLPLSSEGAAGLNLPLVLLYRSQVEVPGNLCRRHGALDVLLVRQHQDGRLVQLLVGQDLVELLPCHTQPLPVCRVHHEYHKLWEKVVKRLAETGRDN